MSLPPYLTPSKGAVLLDVFVQPRGAKDAVVGIHGRSLKLKVKAPPVDGKANAAVEELVATVLSVPRSAVTVVGGESSRHKRVAVAGMAPERIVSALEHVLGSPAHERG